MSRITSKHTSPEIKVRKVLRMMGLSYRLHSSSLLGKPDIVITKLKTVIFINGCFWHQHYDCKRRSMPKTNTAYWKPKLEGNAKRQKENISTLQNGGWKTVVIWECQTKKIDEIIKLMKKRIYG